MSAEMQDTSLAQTSPSPASDPQSLLTRERLMDILRRVPELLYAGPPEQTLQYAADVLTSPLFYEFCVLLIDDPELGQLTAVSGGITEPPAVLEERFRALREQLANTEETSSPESGPNGIDARRVRVPIKNHDGERIGIAELTSGDTLLFSSEMLALIEIFLLETAEAVEQIHLRRELEANEATYRSLVDNVSDVIFRVNREGKFTFISRQIQDLIGTDWRDVRGARVLDIVSPQDETRAREAYETLLNGRAVNVDLTLLRPDGQEVVAFVAARPQIEDGRVVGALGVARDVTEKRRLEEQIAESERRYRALTENAYDAILLVDPATCSIVDSNPQAEKLTGYSRGELLSMTVLDLRRPDQADDVRRRIEEVMRTGVGRFEDASLLIRTGEELDVDTAASIYELEGKRYYLAIIRDVSEQKRMYEALRRRILELQVLSTVSDSLQSTVDLQSVLGIVLSGVTAGSGLGFNRAFIFSYDKANRELRGEAGLGPRSAEEAGQIWQELESRGLSLAEILDEMIHSIHQDADRMFDMARHFYVTLDDDRNVFWEAIRNREAVCVKRDRVDPHLPEEFLRQYPVWEFAIVPLVTRDDVMGVILVDNLITQRPIAEDDLHRLKLFANSAASAIERSRLLINLERKIHELTLANQDLKASRDRLIKTERLSAIGEVAASVAHEIRNPLTAIGGFARSVFTSLGEDDKNRRKIQVILEETDRLEHMLSSLLEFTRPAVPRFTELDLNSLILQTAHFMATEIDPAIQVVHDLNPEIPHVWADGQQVRQVLMNVIRNGLQEMPKGGRLIFTTRSSERGVQVDIQDTGSGIAPEHLDKIFDAFFTTKPSGSGLGLSICAQIMRNHNGRLEVSSKQGEGATFTLTLPAVKKALDSY